MKVFDLKSIENNYKAKTRTVAPVEETNMVWQRIRLPHGDTRANILYTEREDRHIYS
jgi:hypothetical protein